MTYLNVKSASESDLIKPLYENGDALKKKERLSLGSSEIVERRLPSSVIIIIIIIYLFVFYFIF